VLAELCEIGIDMTDREQHMEVRLAFDRLAASARVDCLLPQRVALADIDEALAAAHVALVTALEEPDRHQIEPLDAAMAAWHINRARNRR
jgi:hypothetical protein